MSEFLLELILHVGVIGVLVVEIQHWFHIIGHDLYKYVRIMITMLYFLVVWV